MALIVFTIIVSTFVIAYSIKQIFDVRKRNYEDYKRRKR